jgi:hypothetical protein
MSRIDEIIYNILDKGVIKSNENLDICCPDCSILLDNKNLSIYVLASVDKYLEFAELLGCKVIPALADTTEQPLGAVDDIGSNCNCCTNIFASLETKNYYIEQINYDTNNTTQFCPDNFNSCVDNIIFNFSPEEVIELLNKGFIEHNTIKGLSQLCIIDQYLDMMVQSGATSTVKTKYEIFNDLLDDGIIISCFNDEFIIGNYLTWKKWYDLVKPLPPAMSIELSNKNNKLK